MTLGPDARALLDAARNADEPDAHDKARVQARLAAQLGAAAFGSAASGLTGSAAASASQLGSGAAAVTSKAAGAAAVAKVTSVSVAGVAATTKVWLALGAVAVLAGGGALTAREMTQTRAPSMPEPTPRVASGMRAQPQTVDAVDAVDAAEAPSPRPARVVADDQALPVPRTPASATPRRRRATGNAPAPTGPPATRAPALPIAAAQDTLNGEVRLLRAAQEALQASRYAQALSLAEQHARRFPEGMLRPERLGVIALARCGQGLSGGSAAHALLREAPDSPVARRVARACDP